MRGLPIGEFPDRQCHFGIRLEVMLTDLPKPETNSVSQNTHYAVEEQKACQTV